VGKLSLAEAFELTALIAFKDPGRHGRAGASWLRLQLDETRVPVLLRTRRFDIYGNELDRDELHAALRRKKRQIAAALAGRLFVNEVVVDGTVDSDRDDDLAETERELVLDFGVQLTEV
jgi:hypothetical protein